MTPATLLAVAHGTHDPAGPATVRALLDRVRALRPGLRVAEAYAELASPSLEEAVRQTRGPVVAVPLLLARGYHALIDIPGRLQEACGSRVVTVARPLGPHPLLSEALADRLAAACLIGPSSVPDGDSQDRPEHPFAAMPGGPGRLGPGRSLPRPARPGIAGASLAGMGLAGVDAVVLGAAGSSDPAGVADVRAAARLLTRRLRRPVRHGFVAAGEPGLAEAVARLREHGAERVAVAAYLLAPGFFHDRMSGAGADLVSPPLGAHDAVARLVLRRFDEARARTGGWRSPREMAGRAAR
ncbi:Sirohydrochlorin ferrochelatase [Thermomonospora echinospora]|uniref:Sirohydrochlorin ferrochelatase n=1 Tax=Thermomonospora echinospora TaxID=1992 RepID=A0A1H6D8S8_9ACTN|nr:CbiX/SirB N-terminal domain-containing protein [Thermomonospora echinospora]SEG81538.1 Sirohydrochlorin ferrochelatase [Thermomonospora echinospora]